MTTHHGEIPATSSDLFIIILSNLPLTREQVKRNTKIILMIILMNLCHAFGQLRTVHGIGCSYQLIDLL